MRNITVIRIKIGWVIGRCDLSLILSLGITFLMANIFQ